MHPLVKRALTVALAAGLLSAPAAGALARTPDPSPSQAQSSQDKVTFTIGILSDVDSTNPFTGIVVEAYEAYALMYDYLVTSSPKDVSPQPSLAESYQEAPDKKSWTYKIRSGVTWSDGTPLTARDAAYTFNRIIDGDFEQTNYGNYVANIERAEATDDTTLVLHVKKPTPIMERLAVPILPEHVWKDIDGTKVKSYANEPEDGKPIVGSGPFRLVERRKGQFLRFEANKQYWGGAPAMDEVVMRVFLNADAMAQALLRGEIDFAYDLQSNVFESLKNKPGITTRSSKYPGFNEIAFNNGAALADGTPIGDGHPALKDKQVRLAISYAIDRETLVARVLNGNGAPGDTFIPSMYPALHLDPSVKQTYDPAKANQLLDAAGYAKGSDGIRAKDGKKLALRLFVRDGAESQATGEFVKSWLKDIGIDVTVKVMSEDALTEIIGQGDFDMFEWGWVVEPDPDYQMSTFTCGKRSYKDGDAIYADLSDSFYCNPEYDQLYDQQSGETDPAKRAELAKRMQQLVYDDAAYAITYYYDDMVAYRSDRWTGFVPQPDPDGSILFQYGVHSYLAIKPVSAASPGSGAAADTGSGMSGSLVAAVGGGAVVAVVAVLLVARRRRAAGADERE
ncbi:ABC transporter substrate-binding protein [Acrocarpospora catenulata]|uniref:ABC transporter substrate-binding protein n=1 Tax=Acrocarpospora catenulata TaxID=2836182 RepID=UPI001BDA24C6|nr:ABC transporter substrate-binding protein [Acrocarpospora catenulata]